MSTTLLTPLASQDVAADTTPVQIDNTGLAPGRYFVYAWIASGGTPSSLVPAVTETAHSARYIAADGLTHGPYGPYDSASLPFLYAGAAQTVRVSPDKIESE